jgi:hypothetical protein
MSRNCACGASETNGGEFYAKGSRCKPCHRQAMRSIHHANRAANNVARRERYLLHSYGLTPSGFDAMLTAQGGGCAICSAPEPGGRGSFHVDHDHKCCPGKKSCGKCVRGLLCDWCNRRVLPVLENDTLVDRATAYLERAAVPVTNWV